MPLIQATRKAGFIYRTTYDHLILIRPSTGMKGSLTFRVASCQKNDVWGKGEGEKKAGKEIRQNHCFPKWRISTPTSAPEQGPV